jgi:hypothetical protein
MTDDEKSKVEDRKTRTYDNRDFQKAFQTQPKTIQSLEGHHHQQIVSDVEGCRSIIA